MMKGKKYSQHRSIVLLAHNIRSMWNVGSLFRSADAFGIHYIYLTGYTAHPPRKEISKTALGAEEFMPWAHAIDPVPIVQSLRNDGYQIVALEIKPHSIPIQLFTPKKKVCLLLGNEIQGIDEALLKLTDATVQIPMCGMKESLNVAVAAGIAMYTLTLLQT